MAETVVEASDGAGVPFSRIEVGVLSLAGTVEQVER
jgi:hypothetical protein